MKDYADADVIAMAKRAALGDDDPISAPDGSPFVGEPVTDFVEAAMRFLADRNDWRMVRDLARCVCRHVE